MMWSIERNVSNEERIQGNGEILIAKVKYYTKNSWKISENIEKL